MDDDGHDRSIAYFSRKLLLSNRNVWPLRLEWKVYLIERQFIIQTDHRSLKWLNCLKENNSRLTRWSLALQPYTFKVVHRVVSANGNADGLSRGQTDAFTNGLLQEKGERTKVSVVLWCV